AAPTGSGKTVILELALLRLIQQHGNQACRAIYIAPTKASTAHDQALCAERAADWSSKFAAFGLKCEQVTGDTDTLGLQVLRHSHIIVTTPEKWDAITRRWQVHCLCNAIRDESDCLQQIDEVHVLNGQRGATLEVVVSRMRATHDMIRCLAVSATIPNACDISEWLYESSSERATSRPALLLEFDNSYRPVPLEKVVLGYAPGNMSSFLFDRSLDQKLLDVILRYAEGGPTLIFCSTRKAAQQAAETLCPVGADASSGSTYVQNRKLSALVLSGMAFHHAGLSLSDRQAVERLFSQGSVAVVCKCTTSTLAVGVNLPAHLVIIKSTKGYANASYTEYTSLDVLQMIGRAGRPQYDCSGTAVILTTNDMCDHYERMVTGKEAIETQLRIDFAYSLHKQLCEHLNAETSLGTIKSIADALKWLQSTFLYTRIKTNPRYYLAALGDSRDGYLDVAQVCRMLKAHRYAVCRVFYSCLHTTNVHAVLGQLMTKHCLQLETMLAIKNMGRALDLEQILGIVTRAKEFEEFSFHPGEKKFFNSLRRNSSIRFPVKGKC
ncbi:P-loop containing nucleoside triphosphate hydrolase protein, partial [Thamnocephalis sphaerospora]